MENNPQLGIYRHYKGNEYRVICVAKHSETLEKMVVYQALHENQEIWVRPVEMFMEKITIEGREMLRFAWIRE